MTFVLRGGKFLFLRENGIKTANEPESRRKCAASLKIFIGAPQKISPQNEKVADSSAALVGKHYLYFVRQKFLLVFVMAIEELVCLFVRK